MLQDDEKYYILLSGGVDSAVCLKLLKEKNKSIKAIYIDYGQKSYVSEVSAAQKISKFYNVELEVLRLEKKLSFGSGEVIGRNMHLISTLMFNGQLKKGVIVIGIHSGCEFYDTSIDFYKSMQMVLLGCSGGRVDLLAPLIEWTKADIYQFALESDLPLRITYSCEEGPQPCGNCVSCRDRKCLNSLLGVHSK